MDFRGIVDDTTSAAQGLVNFVLSLDDVAPETKERVIAQIYATVGEAFTMQTFQDVSFLLDSLAINSKIAVDVDNQLERLAQKVVRDNAFELNDERISKEYFDVLLARSEDAAFRNAHSLEKHPTLTRMMVGETCDWCKERQGTWTDPDYDLFSRHDNCDCLFIVRGYNSRNGRLNNYTKASVESKFIDQNGLTVGWYDRLRRVEAGEDKNNFTLVKDKK